MKAGKLAQLDQKDTLATLSLEYYDLETSKWSFFKETRFLIENEPFGSGAFRKAYKAKEKDNPF